MGASLRFIVRLAALLLILQVVVALPAGGDQLSGRVTDETGEGLKARVTAINFDSRESEVCFTEPDGSFEMQVPEGRLHVLATRGPEWSIAETETRGGDELMLVLQRLIDMPARGWWGADLHMHSTVSDGTQPPDEVAYACRAEGLHIAALTDHNTVDHHEAWLQERRESFLPLRGQEITTRKGHFLGINHPSLIDHEVSEGEQDIRRIFREVREDGGISVVAHPYVPGVNYQFPEIIEYDAMEILNGSLPPYGTVFDFAQGRKAWHRLLSQGHRIPVVGTSDCHDVTSGRVRRMMLDPEAARAADARVGLLMALVDLEEVLEPWAWKGLYVGFYRTYLHLDELSEQVVAEAVTSGRGFVTNGPLLIASVDDELPGSEIELGGRESLEFTAEMVANRPLERLDILVNGEVQSSISTNAQHVTATVPVQPGDWIVAELYGQWPEFATTNAWYVE